jgi:hypothetical protein
MPKRTRKRTRVVLGGVDTHDRTHRAAVIDQQGRLPGDQEFPAGKAVAATGCCWAGTGSWTSAEWKPPAATAPA